MEGFVHIKVAPWLRRMITRTLAIIPTDPRGLPSRASAARRSC